MTWWNDRLAAFDVETTSVDVETARIVSATVALVSGGQDSIICTLPVIDPGIDIPEGASAIHGITTQRAREQGTPAASAIPQLAAWLRNAVEASWPVTAFNARFDLTILDRECRRYDVGLIDPPFVVDPFVIDKHLDPYRRGSRKLQSMCEAHGIELADAHVAENDALAAARLAWVLCSRGEVKRRVRNADEGREKARLVRHWENVRTDLGQLHRAQERWAAEQAVGLRVYFEGKGQHEDAASVREAWPVVPYVAVAV